MTQLAVYRSYLCRHPRLTYLFVELTNRCNLRCLHCGSSCEQASGQFIETSALLHALKEVAEDLDPRGVMVCLTGGEPLLHPDFYRIASAIRELGFPWGITTNGTLIDETAALLMKAAGLGSITVSLDGLDASHDWLRCSQGSFERTVQGIKALQKASIPVQVTTVVHKRNFAELEPMFQLMKDLQVSSWRAINIEPIGRALEDRSLLLNRREILDLLAFIRTKRFSPDTPMDVRYGCSHYLSFEYEHELRDNYFLCGAGILVGSILCNGDIASCLDIERRPELVQGNIARDRFVDVWKHGFAAFRRDRSELNETCRTCRERDFCAADSMHTWDFDNHRPMFCFLNS